MKITILGSGTSGGVPLIGCECKVCYSNNPKNKRLRASILIEMNGLNILVDTSPDLRQQSLQNNIKKVDAVIFTHAHADHSHGLDELRSFNFLSDKEIPIYADKETFEELMQKFHYAFLPRIPEKGWFRPALIPHIIKAGDIINIGDVEVKTFHQRHGNGKTIGLRIGDFAYSTDVNYLNEDAFLALKGVKIWIVDCLRYEPAPTHSHLELTLDWINRVSPERAILTHMNHEMEYVELSNQLPPNVEPAYDGMVIYTV